MAEQKKTAAAGAPKAKEPITVERKLEMALSDIEKARPRTRKPVKVRHGRRRECAPKSLFFSLEWPGC